MHINILIEEIMTDTDPLHRSANLLNAFGAMLADALAQPTPTAGARGGSETAALITIASYPGQSIKILAKILGLSHSAAVRLVEKLGDEGLVDVARGHDRRQAVVAATVAGQEITTAILAARRARLLALLGALDRSETDQLTRLMAKMIAAETRSPADGDRLCRFCDLANCPQEICPVEQEACRLRAAASVS